MHMRNATRSRVDNETFLTTLSRFLPHDARLLTCSFTGDPYSDDPYKWKVKPWKPGLGPFGKRISVPKPDHNNYVCVSSFYPDAEEKQYRRRKAQFAQMHCLMVDDVGTKVPEEKIKLPFTAVIETSPGNYQGYYFLRPSPAAANGALCANLIKQMIANGLTADGVDPGMAGVTRVGRLPIGINGKKKYLRAGVPYSTRATLWKPGRDYTLEEIAEAYGLDATPPPVREKIEVPPKLQRRYGRNFNALYATLLDAGMVLGVGNAWIPITCPWLHKHTDKVNTGTAIAIPAQHNAWRGGFQCHHGHCEKRTLQDLFAWRNRYLSILKAEK